MDEVEPPSPTSLALQSLNMSRDDLARHTYQMRSFLQTSAASLHVLAANEPATHVPPPTTVHPSIATATNDTRPSLDMVLEATQKKRKDSRRDRKQGDATSPRSSTQSIRNTSSRPSSVCSSFQDVFYSRPASTAPSFRRSASFSSQTSITIKRDEDEEESRVPALTPIKQQRPLNAIPPQIVIPSSSSPTYEGTASSPVDPRTPYRPPIHLMQGSNGRAVKGRLPANSVSSPAPVSSPNGELGYPFTLPSGPRLTSKPHYSYAALIGQALMSSPKGRLSLNQIYTWISLAYPYFKRGESGWQNSIRHNLSLNGCFVKIKRDDGEKGKGSWWAIREGDEMCFSGGGFQRQGRANGRKRKGKEETLEDPPTAGYPESEPEDDGASPKKKRKAALAKSASSPTQQGNVLFAYPPPPSNTAGPSFSKSRSKSAKGPVYAPPGGADPNAKITTFNGVNVHGHPLAHLLEAAALNPAFQATLANGAQYDTLSSPKGPRLRTLQASDLSSSPRDHHGMPYEHEEDVHEPEEAQQDIGDGSVRHPSLLQLVQLHRAASVHSFASTNSLMNDPADEDDDNSEHDQIPVLEPPHMTQSMASALGQPFEMDTTRSSSPNSSPLSAAPTSLASSSSSSSASLSLQPGFTFVPPAKKSKRSSAEGVYIKEEPYEDEDGFTLPRAKLSNVYHDEDPLSMSLPPTSGMFSSSPISNSRTKYESAARSKSRSRQSSASGRPTASSSRAPSIAGATDLLSRVLESKALKKSTGTPGSARKSKSTMFHRPTTPDFNFRPTTPPPKSSRSARGSDDEDDDDDNTRMMKQLDKDPQLAAAVSALASLSPNRTPMSHAAFHMSPAAPPSSDLHHYKNSLLPPASPFRTPGRKPGAGGATSSFLTPNPIGGRNFDYYDYLGDGSNIADELDKSFGSGKRDRMGHLIGDGGGSPSKSGGSVFMPRTPATPVSGGLFASSTLYQSPSLPSPGWRRY